MHWLGYCGMVLDCVFLFLVGWVDFVLVSLGLVLLVGLIGDLRLFVGFALGFALRLLAF